MNYWVMSFVGFLDSNIGNQEDPQNTYAKQRDKPGKGLGQYGRHSCHASKQQEPQIDLPASV
ncbi:MAG TPA: hypothetical protein DIW64_03010 [Cellvibrio sp.]|nr:hypothetical protein [Cellvibrio sp.]